MTVVEITWNIPNENWITGKAIDNHEDRKNT